MSKSLRSTLWQRVGLFGPTLLLGTLAVFFLVHLVPGDIALTLLGERATDDRIAFIREQLGLNRPLLQQYWAWLSDAVQLDFGESLLTGEPVFAAIRRTFPITLQIVVGGLFFSLIVGTVMGIVSARRAGTAVGETVSAATAFGVAIPSFWLGLILVSTFSLNLGWLPATGFASITDDPMSSILHTILPAVALGAVGASEVARQVRAAMLEVLQSDFVRTLRAKGLPERSVVWKHGLKNSATPLLTVAGLQVNRFLGATVVVEAVFGIPGMGDLIVDATQRQDIPVVQGAVLVMMVVVVLVNLVTDLSYRWFDPRIGLES